MSEKQKRLRKRAKQEFSRNEKIPDFPHGRKLLFCKGKSGMRLFPSQKEGKRGKKGQKMKNVKNFIVKKVA